MIILTARLIKELKLFSSRNGKKSGRNAVQAEVREATTERFAEKSQTAQR